MKKIEGYQPTDKLDTSTPPNDKLVLFRVSPCCLNKLNSFTEYCDTEYGLFIPSWMIDGFIKSNYNKD